MHPVTRSRPSTARLAGLLLGAALVATASAQNSGVSGRIQAEQSYKAGMGLVQEGRLQAALTAFQQGLRSDPSNRILLNALGATYSLMGDSQQAEWCFLRVLAADPRFVPARKNLALEYFKTGRFDLARREFEQLAQDGASQPVAHLFLGILSARRHRYAEAAAHFEKSGDVVFHYPQAILALSQSLLALGRPERCWSVLDRLGEAPGAAAADYLEASRLYADCGHYSKALEMIERARQKDPALPRLDEQRAVILSRMGRSAEALKVLELVTAREPHADSLNLLAHMAERVGDLALAVQSLRQAAELAPEREENYLDYSTLCLDYGNYPLALEVAEVGLSRIPRSYRLMVQRGAVLDKLGRRAEAERVLRRAAALQPENSEALLSLAVTQSHDGRLHEAIETLTAALARFPQNYYMHYYLGNLIVQLGERQGLTPTLVARATDELDRAIRLNPDFADAYFQLAKLYLKTDSKAAEENLLKCLAHDPRHPSAKYELGRLYLRTGRRDQGRQLLEEFAAEREEEKVKEEQRPRIEARR
jgi:tetratricopeptide (TPR) repeat protein